VTPADTGSCPQRVTTCHTDQWLEKIKTVDLPVYVNCVVLYDLLRSLHLLVLHCLKQLYNNTDSQPLTQTVSH